MHDLQKIVNAMGQAMQSERSNYHVTLGELCQVLSAAPQDSKVVLDHNLSVSPGSPDSYRGYYSDLAFAPSSEPITVKDFKAVCQDCLGKTFEGYKGGDYTMGPETPLWLSSYGTTRDSRAIVGIHQEMDLFVLQTKVLDD